MLKWRVGTISFALDAQAVRPYSCVWPCGCYWGPVQCNAMISPSFPVKIFCNGDDCLACIHVDASMERSRWPWTNRWYVCAWLRRWYWVQSLFHYNIPSKYTTMALVVCIYLGWIDERSCWPWTNRPYVCILAGVLEFCRAIDVYGEVIISPSFPGEIHMRWSVCVYLGFIDETISLALDGQIVRLHSCDLPFEM